MALQVPAPTRRPRQGGIKSVIGEFTLEPRLAAVNQAGGIAWEDSGCALPSTTRAACYDDVVADAPFTFDGVNMYTSIGDPFAGYAGVECFLGGDDDAAGPYVQQAEKLLLAGEDRYVESHLWGWAVAAASPGTATTIAGAVALAEEDADANYVGQPVLLMSREASILAAAARVIRRENGVVMTINGTPVIATGSAPSGDVGKIMAIGMPAVFASPVLANRAPYLEKNQDMAIAQRVYAIGVDCNYRHAVAVSSLTP